RFLAGHRRLHSASTRAVLPEPTGPPTPILRGLAIMIGIASHRVWHGAWRRFRAPARSSIRQPCPYPGLLRPARRWPDPETTEFAALPTAPVTISEEPQQQGPHRPNRG